MRYNKDGKGYPSVTEIISDVYAKDIEFWRWRLRDEEKAKKIGLAAANKGTLTHNFLAKLGKGKKVKTPAGKAPLKDNFKSYMKNKHVVLSEEKLFDIENGFAGTPDMVWKGKPDGYDVPITVLEDYKTGKIRREGELQLGGYSLLLKTEGIQANLGRLVQVKGNAIIPAPYIDLHRLETMFLNTLELYKWKHDKS